MSNVIDKQNLIDQINALTIDGEFTQDDVNYLVNYLIAHGELVGSPRDMIQVRRGNVADLPNLAQGEIAFTLDTEEFYVGGANGNVRPLAQVDALRADIATNIKTQSDLQQAIDKNVSVTINISTIVQINSNVTIPSRIRLVFTHGGMLRINSGVTLKIDGMIDAGFYQIFSFVDATSIVTTTDPEQWETMYERQLHVHFKVKVDWFGAVPDAVHPLHWSTNQNSLPLGTDSSDGIRRAFRFAMNASLKGAGLIILSPKVLVEASPNGSYYVRGHNLIGCQDNTVNACYIDFEGNGCQFLHEVLTNTDDFLGNANKLFECNYRNFSVNVYNANGQQRIGRFLSVNGAGISPIQFVRPRFFNIRVAMYNIGRGYDIVFNIDGNNMTDNGHVEKGFYGSFNTFFKCTNDESVNWKFSKLYIHPTTANAIMFHYDCKIGGKAFTVDACEMLISENGEQMIVTKNGQSNFQGTIQNSRCEMRAIVDTIPFDLKNGNFTISGLDFTCGAGAGVRPNSYVAKLGRKAEIKFIDCILPSENFALMEIDTDNDSKTRALQFINTNMIVTNAEGNGGGNSYPRLHCYKQDETLLTIAQALQAGYAVHKVSVTSPNYVDYDMMLDIEMFGKFLPKRKFIYSALTSQSQTVIQGGIFPRLPHYCVINSIKLFTQGFSTADIDGIKVTGVSGTSGVIISFDTTLDGVIQNGLEIMPTNKHILIGEKLVKLVFQFTKAGVIIADALCPRSYAEIEYRGVMGFNDYNNDAFTEYGLYQTL